MSSLWSGGVGLHSEAGNPIRKDGESPAFMRGELSSGLPLVFLAFNGCSLLSSIVYMMKQPIQYSRGYDFISEYLCPVPESLIRGDN